MRRDNPFMILVTPFWTTQPWYPQILQLSCDNPIFLPKIDKMLILPYVKEHVHPLQKSLQLVTWTVCGDSTKVFQQNQQKFLAMHAELKPPNSTNPQGNYG